MRNVPPSTNKRIAEGRLTKRNHAKISIAALLLNQTLVSLCHNPAPSSVDFEFVGYTCDFLMLTSGGGLWKEMAWTLNRANRRACPAGKSGIHSASPSVLGIANHAPATGVASALFMLQLVLTSSK